MCVEVSSKYGWPLETVCRVTLVDIGGNARVAKVNMEIVLLMRLAYPLAAWSTADLNNIWSHYWGGNEDLSVEVPDIRQGQAWHRIDSGVIWEWLSKGKS